MDSYRRAGLAFRRAQDIDADSHELKGQGSAAKSLLESALVTGRSSSPVPRIALCDAATMPSDSAGTEAGRALARAISTVPDARSSTPINPSTRQRCTASSDRYRRRLLCRDESAHLIPLTHGPCRRHRNARSWRLGESRLYNLSQMIQMTVT